MVELVVLTFFCYIEGKRVVHRYHREQCQCLKLLVMHMEPHRSKTVHFKQSNSTCVLVSQVMILKYMYFFFFSPPSKDWIEIYLSTTKHESYKRLIFGSIFYPSCWICLWIYHMFQYFLFSLDFDCLKWLAPSLSPDVSRSCYRNEARHQIDV